MNSRLNISLKTEDKVNLMDLRDLLEKKIGKRLSWAEVIREAIKTATNIIKAGV